jgi:hypothetical protein
VTEKKACSGPRSTYSRNSTTYVEKKPGLGVWGLSISVVLILSLSRDKKFFVHFGGLATQRLAEKLC